VENDSHAGEKVKHRSRVRKNPDQPNLRQVHLLHSELFEELTSKGFRVSPGDIGENITTEGIDLLGLVENTILKIGDEAIIEVKGLRNPCTQLDDFQAGLMQAVLEKGPSGELIRKSGIMGVVLSGGIIKVGDSIDIEVPPSAQNKLQPV